MTRLRARLKRGTSLMLLPLSVLPFVFIGPGLVRSHQDFEREQKSKALPAPAVVLSAAELTRWKPLPAFGAAAVPAIAYEGVGEGGDSRTVTQLQLARQLALLSRLGYRTISIHQYRRWRAGLPAGIPAKPVLIAFDGGLLSSFRGADRLLQRYDFRATAFVPTARIASRDHEVLTWRELHAMARSGRWDVQAEGTAGDARVVTAANGVMGSAYAYRRFTKSEGVEPYADWQQRLTGDVFAARRALVAQGFDPVALSVPGGNYGQQGTNDARIPGFARGLIGSQFGVGFVRAPRNYPGYTTRTGDPARFEIGATTTADDLYGWLRAKDPAR